MWNGEAYAVLATGAKAAICEADVSCSALTVEDSGSAYTYLDQARRIATPSPPAPCPPPRAPTTAAHVHELPQTRQSVPSPHICARHTSG